MNNGPPTTASDHSPMAQRQFLGRATLAFVGRLTHYSKQPESDTCSVCDIQLIVDDIEIPLRKKSIKHTITNGWLEIDFSKYLDSDCP